MTLQDWIALAEQGDADAQNKLGDIFANGDGVPLDVDEAVKWLRRRAMHMRSGFSVSSIRRAKACGGMMPKE